jgi:hypothetical protein
MKEITGSNSRHAQFPRTLKVLQVMRNNICGKSQFQYHVVIGIAEKWPPKKMDLLQANSSSSLSDCFLATMTKTGLH